MLSWEVVELLEVEIVAWIDVNWLQFHYFIGLRVGTVVFQHYSLPCTHIICDSNGCISIATGHDLWKFHRGLFPMVEKEGVRSQGEKGLCIGPQQFLNCRDGP